MYYVIEEEKLVLDVAVIVTPEFISKNEKKQ